jgi:hypothetical protein
MENVVEWEMGTLYSISSSDSQVGLSQKLKVSSGCPQ